jgi:hypothetical protein
MTPTDPSAAALRQHLEAEWMRDFEPAELAIIEAADDRRWAAATFSVRREFVAFANWIRANADAIELDGSNVEKGARYGLRRLADAIEKELYA